MEAFPGRQEVSQLRVRLLKLTISPQQFSARRGL